MVRFGLQKTPRGRRQPGGDEQEAEGPSGLPWAKLLAGAVGGGGRELRFWLHFHPGYSQVPPAELFKPQTEFLNPPTRRLFLWPIFF